MASSDDAKDHSGSSLAAMSGISSPNYMRETSCSSARKESFPARSETSSVHACSYRYCSLHGHQHHHHAPPPPLKEFISAKRQLINNRKKKQLRQDVVNSTSGTKKDQSRQIVSAKTHTSQVVNFTLEEEDVGQDSSITICAQPGKKWAVVGDPSSDSAALNGFTTYNQTITKDYSSELSETPSKELQFTRTQKALNKDPQELHEIFRICNVVRNGDNHQETRTETSNETVESLIGEGKTQSSGDYLTNILSEKHKEAICDEENHQVSHKQDNVVLHSAKEVAQDGLHKIHDHSASTAVLELTLQLTQNSSMPNPANVDVSCIGVEESTKDVEVSSSIQTQGFEVKSEGDIATILSDKQKYTIMWHLIYQQVATTEASMSEKWKFNEVDEEESQHTNYKDSTQMSNMENAQKVKDNESAVLNQSAAIELVQEAINDILQCQEQRFDQQLLQYDGTACDNAKELCDTSASAPTEENSLEGKNKAEKHSCLGSDDNLHEINNTIVPIQEQTEEMACQIKMLQSHKKLKKLFVTAMDRLRNIKWSEPRLLPIGAAFEDENVNLRHLSINEKKSREEWMLDYALRNVISSLAPNQKKKVALLIEAFERVNLERKENGFKYHMKVECTPTLAECRQQDGKHHMDSSIIFAKKKVEMQLSTETDTEGNNTDNSPQYSPDVIPDNGKAISTPTSFDFLEKEATKLIQEAIDELLILPEQANDHQSMSTSTTSEEAVGNEILGSGRESSSPKEEIEPAETSIDTTATLEDKELSPRKNLSGNYSKLLKVIMDKKFIKEMNKMRQFKLQLPQELSSTIHLEGEEAPSLRHTATGEKRSWEEWMLDHALQKVIEKLSQAQKRRVSLLVQAFETIGSQAESTTSQRGKAVIA